MGRRRGLFLACFALLCHLLPGVVAGEKAIGKTNSALVCAGSSALKGAANKLLDDAAAGLQTVWQMDLATTREEEQLARVQMCTGTERREGIVKAVSSRIKGRREKVALARNKSEEAMQAAREFAKFAYHVAGGIDAFMLTLATYSAGAHSGSHNARCLNDDPEGTSAETYQAGDRGGEKSAAKVNAMLALIAECRTAAGQQNGRNGRGSQNSHRARRFRHTVRQHERGKRHCTRPRQSGRRRLRPPRRPRTNREQSSSFSNSRSSFPFAVYGGIWTVQSPGTADSGIKLQITQEQEAGGATRQA
ncbi:hypothetical protein, conserved in T. vivax [Trypanosoma vivax Y486]|uniref:Trypanosome variant surface glycoprotein A-type N-terminal domain-containing protein n=1 Tax=Trypanosoma vivax (strain Y486) TaxID=1055687 RepID=F9WLW5_TRYVY|nr:hypothetical protein, conserved in T. vivax [Trypanosoma vivax Y486]|eukprot:CCD18509.1 hypothetical protein, conserved in T. vivax [Trypanosoma vivax Y486]